ncbi:hypothetical protein BHE74_00058810, partial [Ensete ventricosum]
FFYSLFFFLPPLADTVRNRPPKVEIDRYRVVTGRKQPQSAIPPGSGRSHTGLLEDWSPNKKPKIQDKKIAQLNRSKIPNDEIATFLPPQTLTLPPQTNQSRGKKKQETIQKRMKRRSHYLDFSGARRTERGRGANGDASLEKGDRESENATERYRLSEYNFYLSCSAFCILVMGIGYEAE